jgi:hypothetical protein
MTLNEKATIVVQDGSVKDRRLGFSDEEIGEAHSGHWPSTGRVRRSYPQRTQEMLWSMDEIGARTTMLDISALEVVARSMIRMKPDRNVQKKQF